MSPIKTLFAAALTALALVAFALPAGAADGLRPLQAAAADPNLPAADESGQRHDPYIAFVLKGAKPGSDCRLIVESSPGRAKIPNGGLNTQWTPSAGGKVKFALRPVTSGTYFPFAGNEPCKGKYVLSLDERTKGDWDTIRRFSFAYPSFSVSPLPLSDKCLSRPGQSAGVTPRSARDDERVARAAGREEVPLPGREPQGDGARAGLLDRGDGRRRAPERLEHEAGLPEPSTTLTV